MKKRTGIFGGSFDPVHTGHLDVVDSFLKSGLIDDLLILPTPHPPHKKEKEQTPFHHRMKMLELAFKDVENVVISDLEQKLPSPSYTLQTLKHLKKENPDTTFLLCLGEDNLVIFKKWYRSSEILEMTTLIVAERPGFDSSEIPSEILEKTIFVEHKPVKASSTQIRESVTDSGYILPKNVADYIDEHGLYGKEVE